MIAAALLALAQAAAPGAAQARPHAPPVPQRFSILVDPCARASDARGNDIVVCGKSANANRLPLPGERGPPDGPTPVNPDKTGIGALAADAKPCAVALEGCTGGGFGAPLVAAAANGLVTAVSDGLKDRRDRAARRRDGARRVPIPMDDPPAEAESPATDSPAETAAPTAG